MLNLAEKRNRFFFMIEANLHLRRNELDFPRMILIPAFILIFLEGEVISPVDINGSVDWVLQRKPRELKWYILGKRSHFKKVSIAFFLRRQREGVCFLQTLCFGLREIQVFVATNLKSSFLVETGRAITFFKRKLL